MGATTDISWTDATWNVARGCSKVNDDCKFCYMMREGDRYKYDSKTVIRTKTVFDMPLKYKQTKSSVWDGPPLIFTSSLTDWAHPSIDSYRHEMWDIIRKRKDLIFQLLTKRPERVNSILPSDWGDGWDNVWIGASAGNQRNYNQMVDHLFRIHAKTRFLSLEPLTGAINLNLQYRWFTNDEKIDWVIVGGESGNDNGPWQYRPCDVDWIHDIIGQCGEINVPVFVKQLGTHVAKEWGLNDRHAGDLKQWPYTLQYREFPKNY